MELVLGSVFLGVALIALTRVAHYRRELRQVARPMIELSRDPFPLWTPDEPLALAVQRMGAQFESRLGNSTRDTRMARVVFTRARPA